MVCYTEFFSCETSNDMRVTLTNGCSVKVGLPNKGLTGGHSKLYYGAMNSPNRGYTIQNTD